MKRYTKLLSVILLTLSVGLTACNGPDKANDQANNDTSSTNTSVEKIEGDVTYAVPSWQVDKVEIYMKEFSKLFPDIKVEVIGYEDDLNTWLTTQAATGTLPDVVYGWNNLTYPVSQGWVQPLDEFLKDDDEIQYVAQNLIDTYKYDGKVYALPQVLEHEGILVNKDVLNKLNLDEPGYDWTIDEFKELLRKGTTEEYSGINQVGVFDSVFTGMFNEEFGQFAYSQKDKVFKLDEGSWVKGIELKKELEAIPGLVADKLRNQELRDKGKEDDYEKKFGKDVDALGSGQTLFGLVGIWDWGWIRNLNYEFDFYPLPHDASVGYRHPIYVDQAYMTSTDEDKRAAFEVLKYISYGKDGTIERLKAWATEVDENGNPNWIIPPSNHPEVKEYFTSLEYIPGGVKYIYENLDKSFPCYYDKTVPGFETAKNDIINPTVEKILKGEAEANTVAKELNEKVNKVLEEAGQTFEADLKKNANK